MAAIPHARRPRFLSELGSSLGAPFEQRGDVEIAGITHDSRKVRPGWVFLAERGTKEDGHAYARAALEAGAAALVVDRFVDLPVPQLRVPSVRAALGPLAAAFYGWPSQELDIVGVTGTNGKTTTCELLASIFDAQGWIAGQIGTIHTRIGSRIEPAALTTPAAPDLQATLARMVESGVRAVAMEVSSHALDRQRVDATQFDVGVFTNLSAEHLDYHGTIEQYWASKARLFEPGRCRTALICVDTAWGRRLADQCEVPTTTFGFSADADVRVGARPQGLTGMLVDLAGIDGGVTLASRMVGVVNANNVAAAYLAARAIGVSPRHTRAGIETCPTPPGRFEVIRAGQPFLVVVDYAHTPDALDALIKTARSLLGPGGQVHVVVGARGGRDRFKRPLVGKVAAGADRVIFTADSPGDEDPTVIAEQLRLGALDVSGAKVQVETDRRRAIRAAVHGARSGDAVLIVGRGHEHVQHVAGRSVTLDDRDEARSALEDAPYRTPAIHPSPQVAPGADSGKSVSVVIAAHNSAATLSAALESALAQTHSPLEVIVIDDGSEDLTSEVATNFGPMVRVISQPQSGPSAARNVGIAAARGRWVAFLDADDRWHARKLEYQLACAQRSPGIVLVACDWTRQGLPETLPKIGERRVSSHDILVLNRFQTSTVLLDGEIARRTGGFDRRLDGVEDWDLWLRASRAGGVVKLEVPLVQYVDSPAGYSKDLGRVYDAMLVMLRRELGASGLPPSFRKIYAWHLLRWAVAFRLAGDEVRTSACLSDLRCLGLVGDVPVASARYLVPFLARRYVKRITRPALRAKDRD